MVKLVIQTVVQFIDWFIASKNKSAPTKDDFADVIDGILADANQKGDGNIIVHERNGWSYYASRRPIRHRYRQR